MINNIGTNELKRILESLDDISKIVGDCDDWVEIKKMLLLSLPSKIRKLFSKRHPITKEQMTNALEYDLIEWYFKNKGKKLVIRSLKERKGEK